MHEHVASGIHSEGMIFATPRVERININQDFEVREWADRFCVSPEQLREAIRAVGDEAAAIELWLEREGMEAGCACRKTAGSQRKTPRLAGRSRRSEFGVP